MLITAVIILAIVTDASMFVFLIIRVGAIMHIASVLFLPLLLVLAIC